MSERSICDLMTVPALPFYYCVARTPEETGVSVAATPLSSIETAMAELCSSVQLGNRHHPTDLPILSIMGFRERSVAGAAQ